MIWTLVVFGLSLFFLWKVAFPRIAEALDKRQKAIEDSIDAAEHTRARGRRSCSPSTASGSPDARGQADEIVARARSTAEAAENEILAEARAKREEMMEQTRRDIEAETRRAIQQIRAEVADLTVLATEKVTRKSLDSRRPEAARRGGAGRARLRRRSPRRSAASHGRDRRGLRPLAVRGRPGAGQARRRARAARRVRRRAQRDARAAGVLLLALLLHEGEAGRARPRGLGRRPGRRQLPQAADREPPHAGHLPRPARATTRCGRRRTSSCRCTVTSAVELDKAHGRADRRPHRRADRPQGRALLERRAGHPRRHRRPGRQLGARRLRPQPPRTTSQASRQGRKEPQCRSSPTRSPPSSSAASRASTTARPT